MEIWNKNGITVRELKEYVRYLPEIHPRTGEDFKEWLGDWCEYKEEV